MVIHKLMNRKEERVKGLKLASLLSDLITRIKKKTHTQFDSMVETIPTGKMEVQNSKRSKN